MWPAAPVALKHKAEGNDFFKKGQMEEAIACYTKVTPTPHTHGACAPVPPCVACGFAAATCRALAAACPGRPREIRQIPLDCHCNSGVSSPYCRGINTHRQRQRRSVTARLVPYSFGTGCFALSNSGNPGGIWRISQGWLRWQAIQALPSEDHIEGSAIYGAPLHAHPFDTGCLPLSYSGSPGVSGVSHRGVCADVGNRAACYKNLYKPHEVVADATAALKINPGEIRQAHL